MPTNPNAVLSPAQARHLLRRTGFGAPADKLQTLLSRYRTRGVAADWLLDFKPATFKPRGKNIDAVHDKWIKYMITAPQPLQEKLVLFWHDHFATSNDKVENPPLMASQNQLLRQSCTGNFKDLVKAINRDAAMMEYLDTVRNRKRQPNENYARELQELFTLGVTDLNGNTTTRRTTSCRSRAPSPAGTTTTRDCRSSTPTGTTPRRSFPSAAPR